MPPGKGDGCVFASETNNPARQHINMARGPAELLTTIDST